MLAVLVDWIFEYCLVESVKSCWWLAYAALMYKSMFYLWWVGLIKHDFLSDQHLSTNLSTWFLSDQHLSNIFCPTHIHPLRVSWTRRSPWLHGGFAGGESQWQTRRSRRWVFPMEVSINGGYPNSWMVSPWENHGKFHENWWFRGSPILGHPDMGMDRYIVSSSSWKMQAV
jgi:hypothetical protein